MTSKEYWQKRETEHAKKNKMSEQTYAEEIRKTYAYMADQIQKEIDGFYAKYANAEKISLAEAKRRVSKLDIEEYGRKAAKYVKEKDFSDQANEEMRLYNATMKINRLELLKANIGLEMVSGFDELQKYFDRTLTQQTIEEFRRQAGILGNSVQENGKMARAIVDASFHNATYSDRIWMYQDMLKAELDKLLKTGLIQGKNPRELAVHLQTLRRKRGCRAAHGHGACQSPDRSAETVLPSKRIRGVYIRCLRECRCLRTVPGVGWQAFQSSGHDAGDERAADASAVSLLHGSL